MKDKQFNELKKWIFKQIRIHKMNTDYYEGVFGEINIYFDFKIFEFEQKKEYLTEVSNLSIVNEDDFLDELLTKKQNAILSKELEDLINPDFEEYEAEENHAFKIGE